MAARRATVGDNQQQPEWGKSCKSLPRVAPIDASDDDESFNFSSEDEKGPSHSPILAKSLPRAKDSSITPFFNAPQKIPQQKSLPDIKVVGGNVLSFDDFITSLTAEQPLVSPSAKATGPKRNSILLQAKEEALRRDRERLKRRAAAMRLQGWFRRCIAPRILRSRIKLIRLLQKGLIRRLAEAVSTAGNYRREQQQILISRYEGICAELIQQAWRQYIRRKTFQRAQGALQFGLQAIVKGWKTRRVMQCWMLQECVKRVKESPQQERRFCVAELMQTFVEAYKGGRWMKPRRAPRSSTFLRRTIEPTKTSRHSVVLDSLPAKRYISPSFLSIRDDTVESADTTLTTSPKPLPAMPAKPFLKRKSQKVEGKKIDLKKVKTKVSCWVDMKAIKREQQMGCMQRKQAAISFLKRNSLEEFVAIEKHSLCKEQRGRYSQKLPIPQSEPIPRALSQPPNHKHTVLSVLDVARPKVHLSQFSVQKTAELQVNLHRLEPKETHSDYEEDDD